MTYCQFAIVLSPKITESFCGLVENLLNSFVLLNSPYVLSPCVLQARIFKSQSKKDRRKSNVVGLFKPYFNTCNISAFGSNLQQMYWCLLNDHRLALVLAEIVMRIKFRPLHFQPPAYAERSPVARVLVGSGVRRPLRSGSVRAATPYVHMAIGERTEGR